MDPDELPDLTVKDRKVLAICGGGYAGLFAAEFLSRLEARLGGERLGDCFDLISGTSIGGLMALLLAKGCKAASLSELLTDLGPELFGHPQLGLLAPKYDVRPLADKLANLFASARLADLPRNVLVPAINLTGGETLVFGNGRNDPTRLLPVSEAALATSAAQWYLPPHRADHRLYADGALVANSPEAIVAVDAVHGRGWARERVTMMVVGSTQVTARLPGHLLNTRWGLGAWMKDQRLLTTAMRAQMSLARQIAVRILGAENVVSVDVELSTQEQKRVALDKATPEATQILMTLAKEAFERFCADHPLLLSQW